MHETVLSHHINQIYSMPVNAVVKRVFVSGKTSYKKNIDRRGRNLKTGQNSGKAQKVGKVKKVKKKSNSPSNLFSFEII